MSDTTWMEFYPRRDGNGGCEVRYSIPGLGFTVTKLVDEDVARMLDIARKSGYNQHIQEFNNVMSKK